MSKQASKKAAEKPLSILEYAQAAAARMHPGEGHARTREEAAEILLAEWNMYEITDPCYGDKNGEEEITHYECKMCGAKTGYDEDFSFHDKKCLVTRTQRFLGEIP